MKKYIGLSLLLMSLSGCWVGMESALNDRSSRSNSGSIIGDSWGYEPSMSRRYKSDSYPSTSERRRNRDMQDMQRDIKRMRRQLEWE